MPKIEAPVSPLVPKLRGLHLFHFDGAPCAQRVRFALAEKGLARGREVAFDAIDEQALAGETGAWVSRVVSLIKKAHLTQAYAQIQPNMVVPALVHDGVLYTESMDIIEYLDQAFGGEPLVPIDVAQRQDSNALVELGKKLHIAIRYVTFHWGFGRLGKLNAKEENQLRELVVQGNDEENLVKFYTSYDHDTIPDEVYFQHLGDLYQAFTDLEKRLASGQQFLTGDNLAIADIIWAMKVMRLDECGYPFSRHHPGVLAWFKRISGRPAFQQGVMGKHRGMNRAFRVKSRIENALGIGLNKAVNQMLEA